MGIQTKRQEIAVVERERRVWMTLPGDFKKRGAGLLHQQCWCWGFDVRRQVNGARANLLLELGFERVSPPEGRPGATTYTLRRSDDTVVTLWGFGLCFGDAHGGIFVSRFAFWPRWGAVAAPQRAYAPEHLSDFRAARRLHECQIALGYFERALLWIAEYEREVAHRAGIEHREAALKGWNHPAAKPQSIPSQWAKLARQSGEGARFWMRRDNRTQEIERN